MTGKTIDENRELTESTKTVNFGVCHEFWRLPWSDRFRFRFIKLVARRLKTRDFVTCAALLCRNPLIFDVKTVKHNTSDLKRLHGSLFGAVTGLHANWQISQIWNCWKLFSKNSMSWFLHFWLWFLSNSNDTMTDKQMDACYNATYWRHDSWLLASSNLHLIARQNKCTG